MKLEKKRLNKKVHKGHMNGGRKRKNYINLEL